MSKHTKGPWKFAQAVQNNGPNYFAITNGKWGAPTIAMVDNRDDAALIAAAPEMLEALKKVECLIHHDDENDTIERLLSYLETAKNVIADAITKAEGRE